MRPTLFRQTRMSFFIFLTVVQALVAAMLVGVILIQKSEGGGLGVGGSPAGFMSARGAADFLTRATTILATAFVGLSILLAALAVRTTASRTIDASLARTAPAIPADPLAPVSAPVQGVPAAGAAQTRPAPAAPPASTAQPKTAPAGSADPLAGAAKQ
jgi:preprotein translocase subunit SecG